MWFNIDLIIVALFLIVNFAVGFGIRKKESNLSDFKTYSIGNFKSPSVLFLTASMASYMISGGFFLVIIQQSYNTGISYILKEGLFTPLALVIMGLLVFPLYKNTKKGGLTINEWMNEKFHSSFLRALMGLADLLFCFGLLAIQFKAFGTVIKILFNLPPQYENLCIICFAIFLSLYTLKGGFTSIVLTDILQFWVFAIAFISFIIFVVFKTDFLAGVWDKSVIENPKMSIASCFKDYNAIIFTLGIWLDTLAPKINGAKYQRIMMCNDVKKTKKSLFYTAAIFAFFVLSCACMGLLVYSKNPNLTFYEVMPFLLNNYCPTGLKGLLGAGVVAMCISTTESLLNGNAVVFTNDVVPIFHKMFSKKTYLPSVFMARMATILFCCTSVYVALYIKDLFRIFMVFGNFYYPVVMIPSILLILGCNIKRSSIMCGVFCGIFATFLNYILTGSLSSYFLGIIAHLVGLLLTELFVRMRGKNDKASATEQEV